LLTQHIAYHSRLSLSSVLIVLCAELYYSAGKQIVLERFGPK
jgi:hypothetical protein